MQDMALHDLPVIHQGRVPGVVFCSAVGVSFFAPTITSIALGSSQLMTYGTDTAETLYNNRDFQKGPSPDKRSNL